MNRVTRLLIAASACVTGSAYNPPQDSAGPLTVRIEGPAVLTSVEHPAAYAIILVNTSTTAPIESAELRLEVHRGWRIEPAQSWPFNLAAGETRRIDIAITADRSAHAAAHYPLHAYASFTPPGESRLNAHPVLLIETRLPTRPPVVSPPAWQPIEPAPDSEIGLWRLRVFRAVYRVFSNDAATTQATGWHGSEPETRAVLTMNTRVTRGVARESIAIHPPWSGGRAGTMWVEFPVLLPSAAQLRFATAVRDPDAGVRPGDGVTFRVRVAPLDAPEGQAGAIVFERHSDSKTWQEGEADLSSFAGQAIRLQLESHPGPANNTTFDQSYWGEPTLVLGTPPATVLSAMRLLDQAGDFKISMQTGRRGLLDGRITFEPAAGGQPLAFDGFSVRVHGDQLDDSRTAAVFRGFSEEPTEAGAALIRHRFQSYDLMLRVAVEDGALKAGVWLENPPPEEPWKAVYIEDFAVRNWSSPVERVYAGAGNVLVRPEAFRLNYDGHRLSTKFVGFEFAGGAAVVQAVNTPPTELDVDPAMRRATIRTAHPTVMTIIPDRDVWSAAKGWRAANGLRAAGGVNSLAGRFVFDLWGGRYATAAADLKRASLYGLNDAAVVWHNWQRWGYDYRLPEIWPPNPAIGTEAEFRELAAAAKQNGRLFALHDNYIDFYPDAPGFDYAYVAHNSTGQPVKAWLNEGRGAQSYRWSTGAWEEWVQWNLRPIKEGAEPSAYFIDVWSSVGPYDSWTASGNFVDRITTATAWGETFAWIREFLGGSAPQISESGHDALIGWLDGAQTNHLRVDTPPEGQYSWAVWNIRARDSERIPWFDFAHHDRFVLHGAGYESRYSSGLDLRLHGIYSDDYIATEFLTGHPAMVKEAFSREAVRKYWLSQETARALALRKVDHVEFTGGDIHRARVRWEGGGEVTVNRGASDMTMESGRVLPQYGLYARIPTTGLIEAAIERRDGVIIEWSKSPEQLYVNARPPITNRLDIRVRLESLECATPRRCTYVFQWNAGEPTSDPMRVFVHFTDTSGAIRFQGDHEPQTPSSLWSGVVRTQVTVEAPAQFAAGSKFDLGIGLYNTRTGQRAQIEGVDDGSGRIRLGVITLGDQRVVFEALTAAPDPWLTRMNPESKLVEFPFGVITNAGLRLSPAGDSLWLTMLPNSRAAEIRLRWEQLPWRLPRPGQWVARTESGAVAGNGTFARQGPGEIVLPLAPRVYAYELKP